MAKMLAISPNMHLSHLFQLDYGLPQKFWLFAFEHFNVLLGKLPNAIFDFLSGYDQYLGPPRIYEYDPAFLLNEHL